MAANNNFKMDKSLSKSSKIIAFITLLLSLLLLSVGVFAFEIDVTADGLEYSDKRGDNFSAKGNVVVRWKDKKLHADYVEFFLAEKIVSAYGNVKIEESKSGVIYADSATYNYDEESGNMKRIFGYSSNVFIRVGYIEGTGNNMNTCNMNNIKFSYCDLDNPHIYFKAKRGKIVLNERVTIYNAILYINKVPVFYVPIHTKFLNEKVFFSKLKVNNVFFRDEKGLSSKTTLSYPLAEFLTSKIIFTPFRKATAIWAGSLKYKTRDALGIIHAYHDADDNKLLSKVNLVYISIINDDWIVRSKMVAYFNSHNLNLSNYEVYRHFYIAMTRQKNDSNLSIGFGLPQHNSQSSYEEKLVVSSISNIDDIRSADGYKKVLLIRPKINFTYYPRNIFWGIMHKFNFMYDSILNENYYNDRFYYWCNDVESEYASGYNLYSEETINDNVCLGYILTKNFNFWKRFTLKPTLEMLGNCKIKLRQDAYSAFAIRCAGCLNLRFRVTDWMDLDFNYCLKKVKNKENFFDIISHLTASNCGYDGFSLVNYIYIGNMTVIKNFFSCKEKEAPLLTEITWNPKSFIIAYVKQSQLLCPFKTDYFQFCSKIGELNKSYLNFNVFYKDSENSRIGSIWGLGFWLGRRLRFDYNMMIVNKNKSSIDPLHFEINGFEFKIFKSLHCYNFDILFRTTKNSSGFLKLNVFFKFSTKTTNVFFNEEKQRVGSYFKDFEGIPKLWLY
jgi:LPS-assembly protein